MIIPYNDLQIRINSISDELMGAIYDKKNDDILDQLQEQLALSDDVKFSIEEKCQLVFLGFLRQKDVFEELTQDLKLDSKTALAVYQELERKVFGPYKTQIEENYRAFQSAPSRPVEFPQTQEQVVLKNPIADDAINLKQQIPPQESNPIQSEEKSVTPDEPVPVLFENIESSAVSSHESLEMGKEQHSINSVNGNQSVKPASVQQKNEAHTDSQKKNLSPSSSHQPVASSGNAPFILHKHEEVIPVAQSQQQKGYRQMSFGSFMGSFKTPQTKQQKVSRAQIEIPGIPVSAPDVETISPAMQKNTPTAVPFSVKKYESSDQSQTTQIGKEVAKVVHYTSGKEN